MMLTKIENLEFFSNLSANCNIENKANIEVIPEREYLLISNHIFLR